MRKLTVIILSAVLGFAACNPEGEEPTAIESLVVKTSDVNVDWSTGHMGLFEQSSDRFAVSESSKANVIADKTANFRFFSRHAMKADSFTQICVYPFEAVQSDKEPAILLGGSKVYVSGVNQGKAGQSMLSMDLSQATAGLDITFVGLPEDKVESVTVRIVQSGKEKTAAGLYKIDMSSGELHRTGDGPDACAVPLPGSSPCKLSLGIEPQKLNGGDALLFIVKAAGGEYKAMAKLDKAAEFASGKDVMCEVDMSRATAGATVDAELMYAVSGAHPYLFLNDLELAHLKKSLAAAGPDDPLKIMHDIQIAHADSYLGVDDLFYEIPDGKRLLNMSRRAMLYILPCAYAYRMTGDRKYLDRAVRDLTSVCKFKDWNCANHSLDAGEMSVAVGVGYDWLFDELSAEQRTMIVDALRKNALIPFKSAYGSGSYKKGYVSQDFATNVGNWNQVCCGGMSIGALAIKDKDPELCNLVVTKSVESNSKIAPQLYGDGVYAEGYGYWGYGTNFQALFSMALESALGTDYGLIQSKGLLASARYILYMESSTNLCFNYSDGGSSVTVFPQMWYLAARSGDLNVLFGEHRKLLQKRYTSYSYGTDHRTLPLYIKYFDVNPGNLTHPSEKVFFEGVEQPIYVYKDGWDGQESDIYLGVKGGKASTSHGHIDAGSFVFDADGTRWASEYGGGTYANFEAAATQYGGSYWNMGQDSFRWTVNIVNNKAHSTLTVNSRDHIVSGAVELKNKIEEAGEYGVQFDMTPVLSGQVKSAVRTVKVVGNRDLVVIDKVTALDNKDSSVDWRMQTQASATVGTDRITLKRGSKTRYLKTETTIPVSYREFETKKNPYDVDLKASGFYMVGFNAAIPAGQTATFTTTLTPQQ